MKKRNQVNVMNQIDSKGNMFMVHRSIKNRYSMDSDSRFRRIREMEVNCNKWLNKDHIWIKLKCSVVSGMNRSMFHKCCMDKQVRYFVRWSGLEAYNKARVI